MRTSWPRIVAALACASVLACGATTEAADKPKKGKTDKKAEKKPDKKKEAALFAALAAGDVAAVKKALASGAGASARNEHGDPALLLAAEAGNLEIVEALLEAKADVEAADDQGRTPLIFAVTKGNWPVAARLAAAGANVGVTYGDGWTPLHAAAEAGEVQVIQALLTARAEVDVKGPGDWTPLTWAAYNGHAAAAQALLDAGADAKARLDDGRGLVAVAASSGKPEVVRMLLAKGADPVAADKTGRTPINVAAIQGEREIVKVLLAAKADVNHAETGGWRPLIQAAYNGHGELVKELLAAGAKKDLETTDPEGQTAADMAAERGFIEVADMLRGRTGKPAGTLELPCPDLEGPARLALRVDGPNAYFRVEYPQPFFRYRERAEGGAADTRVYLDVDQSAKTGLEEWDEESLKLKGADVSAEVVEEPAGPDAPNAVNGRVVSAKVFALNGSVQNATSEFEPAFRENVAVFRVPLEALTVKPGAKAKAFFMVGKCGPVTQTVTLGAAAPAKAAKKK
ncbi:MAG TPA: ankyrin repeat domain-containing protein [Vicinamibacteria bacterium]|nr:ankyrin repeat domain-containing protein [Vicinamibacteria bacterium]